ncbi:MAG TPA: DUF2891 domain-containing protein [Sandaracinaceae bacterium LLY-WYZ-13_1]|nr:DUF2891 domain-containing protein [Sandaracinaceae bacterium LLY-WYZ-13_1]
MSESTVDRFARLALACVHREYPNRVGHLMRSDADARPPRELTPAFYGCFDWHSAVHGHWLLAVASERSGVGALRDAARAALATSLAPARIAGEVRYLEDRPGFERPYGLAWLAALHGALDASPTLRTHADALAPLVEVAIGHLTRWLPKLTRPTRSGVHSQTAFALGLLLDWARDGGRPEASLFEARARAYFGDDRDYALHLEPDGEDFLSPSLGAADLMARLLDPPPFAAWLDRALPTLGRDDRLAPAVVTDPADGRLAHLDGLNLSRAWMLRAVAAALPADDARVAPIRARADAHAARGLTSVGDAHYAGSHWLGTFAVYLLERSRERSAASA